MVLLTMCTHGLIAHRKCHFLPCGCAQYDGSQKCYYPCTCTGRSD